VARRSNPCCVTRQKAHPSTAARSNQAAQAGPGDLASTLLAPRDSPPSRSHHDTRPRAVSKSAVWAWPGKWRIEGPAACPYAGAKVRSEMPADGPLRSAFYTEPECHW